MSILQVEFDVGLLECMDAPQILRDYCSEEAIVSIAIQGKVAWARVVTVRLCEVLRFCIYFEGIANKSS